jgi:hypothetical protein
MQAAFTSKERATLQKTCYRASVCEERQSQGKVHISRSDRRTSPDLILSSGSLLNLTAPPQSTAIAEKSGRKVRTPCGSMCTICSSAMPSAYCPLVTTISRSGGRCNTASLLITPPRGKIETETREPEPTVTPTTTTRTIGADAGLCERRPRPADTWKLACETDAKKEKENNCCGYFVSALGACHVCSLG